VPTGGSDDLVRARKHYALSLQHQVAQHNLRAVYGIVYTCKAVAALGEGASESATDRYRFAVRRWCYQRERMRPGLYQNQR
jgi:hypothetical protein